MGFWKSLFGKKEEAPLPSKTPVTNVKSSHLVERVSFNEGLKLPRAFLPYAAEFEKAKREFVEITCEPSHNIPFTKSSFGASPCIPKDFAYPVCSEGHYLFPLAQINFSEVPALKGFPKSGYLQFYIGVNGKHADMYGLDFDNNQKQDSFRVLFFEEADVKEYQTDFSFLKETIESREHPLGAPCQLRFESKEMQIGIGDFQFEQQINLQDIASQHADIEDELMEAIYDNNERTGHRLGGYAHFAQSDPREYIPEIQEYILLFQIDSIDDICWGDVGVGNFFIHPQDLARKDFSKVYYNWDCH